MEVIVAFVVIFIICGLAAIWIYIGPWAMWLVIAAVIFGIYKLYKSGEKAENKKYDSSEYVEKALRFIEFYELGPDDRELFVTPDYIGVYLMGDDSLGFAIMRYDNASPPTYKEAVKLNIYEKIEERFGGSKGMELYRELSLDIKVHDENEDFPTIYMWHRVPGNRDRELLELEKYAKAIQRRYMDKYKKELAVSQFLPGW